MRRIATIATATVLVVVALTGCGGPRRPALTAVPHGQHATIDDCVLWLTQELTKHGTDTTLIKDDIVQKCRDNKAKMTQKKFDHIFMS